MGQISVAEINPVAVVANAAKSAVHDMSVYVCNACKSECNVCGCWKFGFQTFETHEDDNSSDSSWSSDPMKMHFAVGNNQDHGIESYLWEIESRNKPVIINDKHRAGI